LTAALGQTIDHIAACEYLRGNTLHKSSTVYALLNMVEKPSHSVLCPIHAYNFWGRWGSITNLYEQSHDKKKVLRLNDTACRYVAKHTKVAMKENCFI
jgi:hypothetical protein